MSNEDKNLVDPKNLPFRTWSKLVVPALVVGLIFGFVITNFSIAMNSTTVLTHQESMTDRKVVVDSPVVDVVCDIRTKDEYRVSDFTSEFRTEGQSCSVKIGQDYSDKWQQGQVYNKYECNKALYTGNLSESEKKSLPCYVSNASVSSNEQGVQAR